MAAPGQVHLILRPALIPVSSTCDVLPKWAGSATIGPFPSPRLGRKTHSQKAPHVRTLQMKLWPERNLVTWESEGMKDPMRCPYCVSGFEFRLMVGHVDGRGICSKCGHTVHPDRPEYGCSCPHCRKLASVGCKFSNKQRPTAG